MYPPSIMVADLGRRFAITGLDFLEDHDVVLRVLPDKLIISGITVPLHRENSKHGCSRISIGETLSIPQGHAR